MHHFSPLKLNMFLKYNNRDMETFLHGYHIHFINGKFTDNFVLYSLVPNECPHPPSYQFSKIVEPNTVKF